MAKTTSTKSNQAKSESKAQPKSKMVRTDPANRDGAAQHKRDVSATKVARNEQLPARGLVQT